MDNLLADLDGDILEDIELTPVKPKPLKKPTSKPSTAPKPSRPPFGQIQSAASSSVAPSNPRTLNPKSPNRTRQRSSIATPFGKQAIIGRSSTKPLTPPRQRKSKAQDKENDAPQKQLTTVKVEQVDETTPSLRMTPRSKYAKNKADAAALVEGLTDMDDWDWEDDIESTNIKIEQVRKRETEKARYSNHYIRALYNCHLGLSCLEHLVISHLAIHLPPPSAQCLQ